MAVWRAWSGEESAWEDPKVLLLDRVCACARRRYARRAVPHLLALPLVRRVMLGLPAALEAWRERLHLRADAFRNLRCGWADGQRMRQHLCTC